MKSVKHILALVFGLLGLTYTVIGMIMLNVTSTDPDVPVVGNVFSLLGVVFLAATALIWYFLGRNERRRREVLDYGIRVAATVTDVRPNYSVRVNRRHPWIVYAECVHPVTREKAVLRSHNVWNVSIATGQRVDILVDQMNEKRYAFDIPEAEGGKR